MKFKYTMRNIGCFVGAIFITINTYAMTGTITGNNLNVRSGAGKQYQVIQQLDKNEIVHITDKQDDWYMIELNGSKAFIHSDFVSVGDKDGVINGNHLNFRSKPTTTSPVISQFNKGDRVKVISSKGDWYHISYNGKVGFLYKQFVDIVDANGDTTQKTEQNDTKNDSQEQPKSQKKVAIVQADILNIRQQPSLTASKVGKTYYGNILEVNNVNGEWASINSNGVNGYVSTEFVTIKNATEIDENTQNQGNQSALGTQIVNYAKQFLGTRYVWGGNSLTKGVDCSGFTQQVMKHFGININRASYAQASNGIRVAKNQLQAGDLVFFGYGGKISHVGIYIGNGNFIHANDYSTGVIISKLSKNGKPFIMATRVIK